MSYTTSSLRRADGAYRAAQPSTRGHSRDDLSRTAADEQIFDLVAAHDERDMARLLLDERARVQEARSILADLLPALASQPTGFAHDALLRARAFVGDPRIGRDIEI